MKRVLVVEDQEQTRRSLTVVLEAAGYKVDGAQDGLEALEVLRLSHAGSDPIDLVLTDIVMPALNGVQLIQEIRKRRRTLPIVVITGYRDGEMTAQLQQLGCLYFIDKPFEPDELLKMVALAFKKAIQTRVSGKGSYATDS